MNKTTLPIYNSLPNREFELLYSLYNHRCLKATQIYQAFYHKDTKKAPNDSYCKKRLVFLVKSNLIERHVFENEPIYFLTPVGVDFVKRKYLLPTNIYDAKKNVVRRGYFRASELKMNYKNIRHQLHLNQFVLELKQIIVDTPYSYWDEKHLAYYQNIRPDGLFSTIDVDFFLEMDMGTENVAQLKDKWTNYRNFLRTNDFVFKDKKLVMIFIVDGVANVDQRVSLIKKTIFNELIDCMKDGFEVLVGPKDEMLEAIQRMCSGVSVKREVAALLRAHSFSISEASRVNRQFSSYDFDFIASSPTGELFLVDILYGMKMSSITKTHFYNEINTYFKNMYKKDMNYLMICSDEKELARHFQSCQSSLAGNSFFTKLDDLRKPSGWYSLIYQMDSIGNVFSFTEHTLSVRKFDRFLPNK